MGHKFRALRIAKRLIQILKGKKNKQQQQQNNTRNHNTPNMGVTYCKKDLKVMGLSSLDATWEIQHWKCKILPLEDRKGGTLEELCRFHLFDQYFSILLE